ncbi:MAG: envelope stress response membrane protein PspB [Rhodospirillaceae bacterium]|jgi:phage shock protein B|nr:envelope stress response membrane protein PspB [Rhodospirillaceae bacterium]MBT3884788.1 envelope stress response membrane protein PspB [Rhodospirillaceae bacterium]MBT4118077.1 envelope stress response membrane protein PspB [Rhodospirillaceae bacterium]MBT4670877.1 envelope stress response membrane protein PspB [Rhodospirillaceae bacterium]MBT4721474.1 envelope stress response membrane protein PspB [Rhodospirillaceae bacterium]
MSGFMLIPLAALLIVVVLPIWIIAHYGTRWRTNRVITSGDEKLLADLWDTAGKMEARIDTLERILDDEAPDWRTRS